MNIGKKIKKLRGEKLMTQSELAGNEITRNMLSRIENGAALPSLSTIIYLASKLGVPAGYLLSEGDEEFLYHKTNAIKNIKRAYIDKNFELCRDMCITSFDEYDDELELILADSCLEIAKEDLRRGHLHRASLYLDEAIRHAKKTMFDCTLQKNGICLMFEMLKNISPSLDSDEADVDVIEGLLYPIVHKSLFCKYLTVILDVNKYELFDQEISGLDIEKLPERDKTLVLHLKARKYIANEDFAKALTTLKAVMDSEIGSQRLVLYFACSDMEICCRETDDYKGAYESAQNKIEILEHMLLES